MASKSTKIDTGKLDELIAILEGDLASIDGKQIAENLAYWQQALASTPGYEQVSKDLAKLEGLLQDEQPDEKAFERLLPQLGRETKKAVRESDLDGQLSKKLEKIGNLLSQAARQIDDNQ